MLTFQMKDGWKNGYTTGTASSSPHSTIWIKLRDNYGTILSHVIQPTLAGDELETLSCCYFNKRLRIARTREGMRSELYMTSSCSATLGLILKLCASIKAVSESERREICKQLRMGKPRRDGTSVRSGRSRKRIRKIYAP
jgi:hypothetical protein